MNTLLILFLSVFTASALDAETCNSVFFNPSAPDYFNLVNFTAYPEILRDDSKITLSQAGTFTGPKDFQEYVAFATSLSPYVEEGPIGNAFDLQYTSYNNDTDTCTYRIVTQAEYTLNDTVAATAAHFNVTYMINYEMYVPDPYLQKAYVYYPTPYLEFFFDQMSTSKAGNYICEELSTSCNNTLDGEPRQSCVDHFLDLPITHGNQSHFDGNSRGCRVVHAVLAGSTPDLHCPHFAFTPMEDPNGDIKCQESKSYDPMDFFSREDFVSLEAFQLALGVDPQLGYKLYEDSPAFNDTELNAETEVEEGEGGGCNTFEIWCTIVDFVKGESKVARDGGDMRKLRK